jgi:pyridoxamine 5'-phosphate oxidase-like protein
MNWAELERGAPDLAATARAEFEASGMALVGTLRKDGSPRISCVDPCVLDGELYLGMMWRSRKALDLLRDPRVVLHNAIATNTGSEVEVSLNGRAVEVLDPGVRQRYFEAVPVWKGWEEPHFHLFALDLTSGGLVRYEHGEQHVKVWPEGKEFTRRYG